jgi:hypothetical protein
LRRTLSGYELRSWANGCVGSGLIAPILGKVTGSSVSRMERREAGWIACLDWVTCGIDWPAGLFAGAGRDER